MMSLVERINLLNQSLDNKENIEDFGLSRTPEILEGSSPVQSVRRNLTIRRLKDQFEQQQQHQPDQEERAMPKVSRISLVRQYSKENKLVAQAKVKIAMIAEQNTAPTIADVQAKEKPIPKVVVQRQRTPSPKLMRFFGPRTEERVDSPSPTETNGSPLLYQIDFNTIVNGADKQRAFVAVLFDRIYAQLSETDKRNVSEKFEILFMSISHPPPRLGMTFDYSALVV